MLNKSIGTLEIEDGKKTYKIPVYHDCYCGCVKCKLAKGEVSLDFFKGYAIAMYICALEKSKDADDSDVKALFTEDEITDYIWNN